MRMLGEAALAVAACLAAAPARADFSYAACPAFSDADLQVVPLVTNGTNAETSEPLKMAFDMDAQGNVDVYFTQRFGLLRKYVGATKTVVNLHKFTLLTGSSDGLQGIALDPDFKANRWIYLFYSGSATEWRVSRFTLSGDKLDPATEKILLKVVQEGPSQHPGGALLFDPEGNLWISAGDNYKPISAANSNDLRGKILRIKPIAIPEGQNPSPGVGSTYTVPAGNLRETWQTEEKDKIRPEIYVMGTRNAYTMTYDRERKAITWGDVGPDAGRLTEEYNLATRPGNFGWPFYAGNNILLGGGGTPDKPINSDRTNTGIQELMPAIPALHSYKQACAVTGPVYYYDGQSGSKVRFPPHFHGAWFVSDFNNDSVHVLKLNAAGTQVTDRMQILKSFKFTNPIEMQMGPDGALYVVNYAGYRTTSASTGLYRVEYRGSCAPAALGAPIATRGPAAQLHGGRVSILSGGRHSVEIQDLAGRRLGTRDGEGPARYGLADLLEPGVERSPGVYLVTVRTAAGSFTGKLAR